MCMSTPRRSHRENGPLGPWAQRLERLREAMRRHRLDCLLVTNPSDIFYLTGFIGEASAAIVSLRHLLIISDFRFKEELEPLRNFADIIIRKGAMASEQAAALKRLRPRSIAVQAEHISLAARNELAKALRPRRLTASAGLLAALRMKKDDQEIDAIRRAVHIQEEALLATLRAIRPGQTERAVASRLEFEMRKRGADGPSFPTIVAAGPNGSRPHYRAGDSLVAYGSTLLIDWGAHAGGYCSDMTRTFALVRWPRKMKEVYRIVLDAHLAGVDAVRPGRTCAEVDRASRRVIEHAGYGQAFGHGLGHGIGLEVHEAPRMAGSVRTLLEPGMVVTIEPGVYLPGVGGVRIEDDILVTPNGAKSLCSLPKNIEWATLHG